MNCREFKGAFMLTGLSLCLSVFALGISLSGCDDKIVRNGKADRMPTRTIEEVLNDHSKGLISIPGVVGTAQGLCRDKACIKVYVVKMTPELEKDIPGILDGYPVTIEETGEIRALPDKE